MPSFGAFGRAMIPLTGAPLQGYQTYNAYEQQNLRNQLAQSQMQLQQTQSQMQQRMADFEQQKIDDERWKMRYQQWQDQAGATAGFFTAWRFICCWGASMTIRTCRNALCAGASSTG